MSFKINFQLQEIDKIIPWGTNRDYLSWFGLTDGLLWINAGNDVIYEYSQAAREYWKCDDLKFNDYQLSRFLEDLSEIFYFIREPVPEFLYRNIGEFIELTNNWKEQHFDEPDDLFDKFYYDEYATLTEWFFNRILNSGHLIGGPLIGCFRYKDMIKIYWNSDYILDNGKSIWTSPNGIFELKYNDFVDEAERFFNSFFISMDEQVELSVLKDWGKVELDKDGLIKENNERKLVFKQKLSLLHCQTDTFTDWSSIESLFKKMMESLSN